MLTHTLRLSLGTLIAVTAITATAQTYDSTQLVDTNNTSTSTSTVTSTNTNNNNNVNTSTSTATSTSTNTNNNTNTNYNVNSGTQTINNNNTVNSTATSTNTNTNNNINSGDMTVRNINTGDMTNRNINTTTSNNTNVNTSTNTNYNVNSGHTTSANTNTNNNNNVNSSTSTSNNVNTNIQSGEMTNRNINDSRMRVEQPPPTAIAPAMMSGGNNDLCTTGTSGAVQTQILGVSSGGTVRDMNCERLKNAKTLYDMGMKVAAVATLCQDRRVFDAMWNAGTPCPYEGMIGEQAKVAWTNNPDKIPKPEEPKGDDFYKKTGFGALLGALLFKLF